MVDQSYLSRLPPFAAHLLLFQGTFTGRVLTELATASVEWNRVGDAAYSVTVKWHEPERRRSVADPPLGGSYSKLFSLPFDGEDPCVRAIKEADAIIRSLKGG